MPEICTETVTVTTAGEDASAVGSAKTAAMNGYLLDIQLDFSASAPETTDLTVTDSDGNTVFARANSVVDALVAPRVKPVDNANSAITNAFDRFPLTGPLTFALAGCDALAAALVAKVRYERI